MNINNLFFNTSPVKELRENKEIMWINPNKIAFKNYIQNITLNDIESVNQDWLYFAPLLKSLFPEEINDDGLIESPLVNLSSYKNSFLKHTELLSQNYLLKRDDLLPIAGSIKARGGIYEVLSFAKRIAKDHSVDWYCDDNSLCLTSTYAKKLFSKYTIAVGSTGNLGLSIGIMGAKLGFNVAVHMSNDAKQWKKDKLRQWGVTVYEYEEDYSVAVTNGRNIAENDPQTYFIDDENSKILFLGYAVAGLRLKKQLELKQIQIDSEHPLFIYLPCGVGGGPGGVAYGIKLIYGDNVHIFFAEPTASPCMLLGMATRLHSEISVKDIGLTNQTIADGLAVGRPSGFVGPLFMPLLSGIYTLNDDHIIELTKRLYKSEKILIEPSAATSLFGPYVLSHSNAGKNYIQSEHLINHFKNGTHIMWSTGGKLVPKEIKQQYMK